MSQQNSYTLKLSAANLQFMLNVLAERPYKEVAALLQDLAVQIKQQEEPPPVAGTD